MPRSRFAGRSPSLLTLPRAAAWLFLVPACSVFIDLDGDGVTPGSDGDDALSSGGMGGESGGGPSLGGESGGATPTGGSSTGGTGATGGTGGTSSGGSDTGGTGGMIAVSDMPTELHYWKLDDRNGGSAVDAGYMRSDGNVVNLEDWSPGSGVNGEGAFEVKDGASNYVQLVNSVLPEGGTFSLSWWVAPTLFGDRYLVSKQGGNSEGGFFVMQTGTGMRLVTGGTPGNGQFNIDAALPQDGSWSHLVMTYRENLGGTNDRLRFYVNSELVFEHIENISSSSTTRPTNYTQIMRFGAVEGNALPMFTGLVDEIRIYEAELTNAQVSTLHRLDLGQLSSSDIVFYDPRVPR